MLRFQFEEGAAEHLTVVEGPDAGRVAATLFGAPLAPGRLVQCSWASGAPKAAVCWFPPDRLEIRIPASPPWPAELTSRLRRLVQSDDGSASEASAFASSVQAVIRRVEAWHFADTDQGAEAEDLAVQLANLLRNAPTDAAAREVAAARDALDDGMPADAILLSLYRAVAAGGGR